MEKYKFFSFDFPRGRTWLFSESTKHSFPLPSCLPATYYTTHVYNSTQIDYTLWERVQWGWGCQHSLGFPLYQNFPCLVHCTKDSSSGFWPTDIWVVCVLLLHFVIESTCFCPCLYFEQNTYVLISLLLSIWFVHFVLLWKGASCGRHSRGLGGAASGTNPRTAAFLHCVLSYGIFWRPAPTLLQQPQPEGDQFQREDWGFSPLSIL